MIQVTIYAMPVRTINYTDRKGNAASLRAQVGYAHTRDADGNPVPVPEKFEFVLNKDQNPYAPGEYQLHPSAIYVDRNGKLACAPRLAPIARKPA